MNFYISYYLNIYFYNYLIKALRTKDYLFA